MKFRFVRLTKIILFFLMTANVVQTQAQKLNRMGNGLPYSGDERNANQGFHTEINPFNNKVYYPVFWKTADSNTYKLFLDIWDGDKWSFSDTFTIIDTVHTQQIYYNQFNHYQFGFNKDTVIFAYITYKVDASNKITSSLANVIKYDGISWLQIGIPFMLNIMHTNSLDGEVCTIVKWQDTIRIIGAIPLSSLGKVFKWMSKLVNGNWEEDHSLDLASNQGFRADLSNVLVNNDSLWITLKYRDSVWCFVGKQYIGYRIKFFGGFYNEYKLAIKNSEIYLLGFMSNSFEYKLFKLQNNSFESINTGVNILGYGWEYSINVVDNVIVISPLNGSEYYYIESAGKYVVFNSSVKTSIYSKLWCYSNGKNLYFSGNITNISPSNIASASLTKGIITGKTYHDKNLNSILDSGENIIPYAIVYSSDTIHKNIATLSDNKGKYSVFVDFNTPISLSAKKGKHTIETEVQYDTVDVQGTKYHNIPMKTPVIKDLAIKVLSKNLTFARKADTIQYTICVRNNGIMANDVFITASFDSLMDTISLGNFTYNSGILSLKIDTINPNEVKEYTISLWANTKYQLGDYNYVAACVQQSDYDSDSSDNCDTLRQEIISAYDPNAKQCYPSGQTDRKVREIVYQINFENEGSDYARNVVISDTLSSQLPAYEITLNHSSHPYKLSIDGNILYFTFENINLLPNKQDQKASKGYINFSAKLKRDMNSGETIVNKANIYFDFEKPVLTNIASIKRVDKIDTTSNTNGLAKTFSAPSGFTVYPNPTSGSIVVSNTSGLNESIGIYTLDGRLIYTATINSFSAKSIDLGEHPCGIYLLKNNYGEHLKLFYNK